VSGRDGTVTIERPRGDVRVDVLAAAVTLAIDTPVDATIFTTHDPIRLEMRAALPVTIDAATSDGGAIDARAFDLAAESRDGETRLRHSFGETARVSMRNRRGDIVIAQAK
jgi:hypothetical protein